MSISVGTQVIVQWVPGWRLPESVDGRPGVVRKVDQDRARLAVKVDGCGNIRWWFPPGAVRPRRVAHRVMRWAAIRPGRPWETARP